MVQFFLVGGCLPYGEGADGGLDYSATMWALARVMRVHTGKLMMVIRNGGERPASSCGYRGFNLLMGLLMELCVEVRLRLLDVRNTLEGLPSCVFQVGWL